MKVSSTTVDRVPQLKEAWEEKAVLREIYLDYYQRIKTELVPGLTLEVGSGCGSFKEELGDVITTDIVRSSWIDVVADAQALPLKAGTLFNIIMVDVLHHLGNPLAFLKEASRVLTTGGKLVLMEPAITPISLFFYHFFHPERVDFSYQPHRDFRPAKSDNPFDGNQAIPTLLFGKYKSFLASSLPEFRLTKKERLSFVAYPLSGGYRRWSLVPAKLVKPILSVERKLEKVLGPVSAFRQLVVLSRA